MFPILLEKVQNLIIEDKSAEQLLLKDADFLVNANAVC